jgi:hypothetical protein
MRRYHYNVYKDGKIIAKDVECKAASDISGIETFNISNYAIRKKRCHKPDGVYFFEICETIVVQNKQMPVKRKVKDKEVCVDPEFEAKWNEIRKAAEVLKHGGHIVKMGKRKFVVKGR